jgi:YVTN family beta-propeller protein
MVLAVLLFSLNAWAVAPRAYIMNIHDDTVDTVSVMDTSSNRVITTIPVGGFTSLEGNQIAINSVGTYVYTANVNGVSVIDTSTNTVVATVPIVSSSLAINPLGTLVYAVTQREFSVIDTGISIIDTSTNSVVGTIPLPAVFALGNLVRGVALNPEGTYLYVAMTDTDVTMPGGGALLVIDTGTNGIVDTVLFGGRTFGVTVNPAGTLVYVTTEGGVSVIDTKTNTVVTTVLVKTVPEAVAVNPAGTYVYVTIGDGISVIDTNTNSVVATIPEPYYAVGVGVNPLGTYVYVTVDNGTVSVIDASTNSIVATVPVGDGATDIAIGGPAGDFFDVPSNYWAFSYIDTIYKAGITHGCGNGDYCPSESVTRDQMAAFLVRATQVSAGAPPEEFTCNGNVDCSTTTPYFSDVPSTDVFFKYIQKLKELGMTTGCGNGDYCPSENVTRDQMAAFLVRATQVGAGAPPEGFTCNGNVDCSTTTPYFSDVPSTEGFFKYIQKLKELGITTGCGNGDYYPSKYGTRDQIATFLSRAFLGRH